MYPRLAIGGLTVALAAAPASAAEGGGSLLIQPQPGTIIWTVVTFLLLAFVLGRYAWKPLLGAIDERQKTIEGSLDEARQEREQASKLLEEHKGLVAQARRERAQAVAAGKQEAEALRAEMLQQARQQREHLLKQTEEQVRAGIDHARAELRELTADLAIRAAEKLLTRNLDDATQRRLVEQYLEDLERSGAAH